LKQYAIDGMVRETWDLYVNPGQKTFKREASGNPAETNEYS
jgi:hypothetical protein